MASHVGSVYLDYNATTPTDPTVNDAVYSAMKDAWGNPSSSHEAGKKAKAVIDQARLSVAKMVGAPANDVIFTSGGTEANNMVFNSCLLHFHESKPPETKCLPHFISSVIEHDSVKLPLEKLVKDGLAEVTFLPVCHETGAVNVDDVISNLKENTCLISVMMANNETGVIQPIREIADALKERRSKGDKIFLHTDAAQTIGKISVDVHQLGVDYLTIVGHKFYGPRIGALYAQNLGTSSPVYPLLFGGGQERGYRPGTENTAMIAGLGQAADLVYTNLHNYEGHMKEIRDYLEYRLEESFRGKVIFNCKLVQSKRLPNTCNVSFIGQGLKGHRILSECKYLKASIGAACHSQNKPSPILIACGVPLETASNALRLSVGRETSKTDIDLVVEDLLHAVNHCS